MLYVDPYTRSKTRFYLMFKSHVYAFPQTGSCGFLSGDFDICMNELFL